MTKHECAVVMAYTGVCMLTGDDQKHFYEYVAELIGRPVYTHELPGLADTIEEKAKPDFLELCRTATEPTGQGRHGRWIKKENYGGGTYTACSECGAMMNLPWFWYCGKCGAKMDAADDQRGGADNGAE